MIHSSFREWVEAIVIPLRQANPTWERLDGWATGGNLEVAGKFRYIGRVWVVHSDSHFAPVLRAYEAVCDGNNEPFVVKPARKRDCLDLIPALRTRGPKHFYAYEEFG